MITIHLDSTNDKFNLSGLRKRIEWPAHSTIFVFDFDGVLSSPIEDMVYQLPEGRGERSRLAGPSRHYGITPEIYDCRYVRHLVLQNILLEREIDISPGPLTSVANELSQAGAPLFILSARSSVAAVQRAISFLDSSKIVAQEAFFVGRVSKGRQLSRLKTQPGVEHVVYFDDNIRHSRNAFDQKDDNIVSVHLGWRDGALAESARELYEDCLKWFEGRAHGRRRAAG